MLWKAAPAASSRSFRNRRVMPDDRFYITTAIDYPNNRPHIGTAFEKIGADVQARFQRMEGKRVHFLMGNDENTIKVSQRAEALGQQPKAYVDDMARQFREIWGALDISFDDFIQTSEARHHVGCQKFIQAVHDAGHIYKKAYVSKYCDGCEEFKTERDIKDGLCPNHPKQALRTVEEENYFFRLTAFSERLLALYDENPDFIQPESRRNEIVSLVRGGLQDVSISRKGFTWGIKVPFDPEQTIYVWFDALLNYITAIGYGEDPDRFQAEWPADVHVIGKDITRFHCALWPAMLMAAGLPLPRKVFGHGFVYYKGQKTSKSADEKPRDPMEYIQEHGSEAFRYYFMRECPFGGDGNFSDDRFAEVFNADLANNLGNLYSRTITMCQKYFGGRLDAEGIDRTAWWGGLDFAAVVAELRSLVGTFQYGVALQRIWLEVLDAANRYIQATQPFRVFKTDPDACRVALVNLAEALRVVAILIKPFLPRTASTFYHAFNFADAQPWDSVDYSSACQELTIPTVQVVATLVDGKPQPLFPKLEPKRAEAP